MRLPGVMRGVVEGVGVRGSAVMVRSGRLRARRGSRSTGCHLHFEVHVNGETTDPAPFMQERGVDLDGTPVGADGGLAGW